MNQSATVPENLANYLPYGELLRLFLDSGHITSKELREVLRARGVFLSKYSKENAIPHLALATVTPSEFEMLLGHQRQKENSTKATVSDILPWSSERTLVEAMPEIDVSKLIDKYGSTSVAHQSPVQIVDNNPNHVKYDFGLESPNNHKSWIADNAPQTGSVEILKTESGNEVVIEIISTFPETKKVGKKIANSIKTEFKAKGDIVATAKEKKVHFGSFDNATRIQFLLSLTAADSAELKLNAITDSTFYADPAQILPEEIKIIFEEAKRVDFNGEQLQKSPLLKKKKYHSFVVLSRLVVKYDFDYHGGKGSCVVEFKFDGYPTGRGPFEFVTNPESFVIDGQPKDSRPAIKKYVEGHIRALAREKSNVHATELTDPIPIIPPVKRSKSASQTRKKASGDGDAETADGAVA